MKKKATAEEVWNEGRQAHKNEDHDGDYLSCRRALCLNYKARASDIAQRRGFKK